MKKIEALRAVSSVAELALLLGFKESSLNYILFKIPDARKYRTFEIPKRRGGYRTIAAPDPRLKLLQKNLSILLNECLAEIEGEILSPSHGFRLERSIFTNAAQHRQRRHVLNLDLQDFFPSIHFGRIVGYFEKSSHFGLNLKIARILANILCHEAALPQGAPSSPVVSNLLARMLDVQLVRLAKKNRLTYSRYADDLTFSTNLKNFPSNIARQVEEHQWEVGIDLINAIRSCGFRINSAKTRVQYKSSRQEVTGLVVNDKVSVPAEYRRWVRASVNSLVTKGRYHEQLHKAFVGPLPKTLESGSLAHLEGCLSHIYNAHRFNRMNCSSKDAESALHSDEFVYRRFLFYAKFYAAEKAVLVCEGETDSIYLKAAIRALGKNYPHLINENAKSDKFNIKFIKHSSITERILGLNGGTAAMKNFCKTYLEDVKKFGVVGNLKPVIILVDGDKAGCDVIAYIKGIARNQGLTTGAGEEFVFAYPNIYAIKIPGLTKDSVIEHLFPLNLLSTKLSGKTLNLSNHKVGANEYSKMFFAKYVLPTAKDTDFLGFTQLLNIFVDVISDFSTRPSMRTP